MRFKLDENLPVELSELLRSSGHEADTVADEHASGATDPVLAALCKRERRSLITLDRGFADIRAYAPAEYEGIVVLRPEDLMIERMAENDKIVSRYMADREFQGSAFPILAREIFEAIRAGARGTAGVSTSSAFDR